MTPDHAGPKETAGVLASPPLLDSLPFFRGLADDAVSWNRMALSPARVFIRPDLAQVLRLVGEAGLPIDDLDEADLSHFLGLGPRNRPVGVVGLDLLGATALLRSLAVDAGARGTGSGTALVEAAEGHAMREGVETLYLLTTTADRFFERLGYVRVGREKAPPEIRRTREFSDMCPDTAVLMMKYL